MDFRKLVDYIEESKAEHFDNLIKVEQDLGEHGRATYEIDRKTGEGARAYYPNLPLERVFVTGHLNIEEDE